MHEVYGYLVKLTSLKAVKAGNFVGWPLLTEKNIAKYYPDTVEMQKGHMNQSRKNVRSTKRQRQPFKVANVVSRRGKKERDVKPFSLTKQVNFPSDPNVATSTMVMVEVDSNAILLKPMKSCQDNEMHRAYDKLVSRLLWCGVQPKKHVLDNEISDIMKNHIKDTYKFMSN
jgi:hypothetical protein